ncbi:restriction endonuclease subunit S [Crateriforma spongiae]|uniref:restriction endonuclease subunit S n=1 Tax=Crateriforma spongiae TaxID=2724528 RepID=UPI0039B1049D
MSENPQWSVMPLGRQLNLKRGHDLPKRLRVEGAIPIYSSSGLSGRHSTAKCEPPGVITGRYGTIGNVFFASEPYWPLNTTLYVEDFKSNDPKFVYYFLKTFDWDAYSDKSAVPGVNRNHVHEELVAFPPVDEQRAIADVLTSLDDKIDLLHRQNKTLEAMAETLFRQWFVEEAEDGWVEAKLPDEFDFEMGTSPKGDTFNEHGEGMPMYQGNADFGFRFPQRRIYTTAPKRTAKKGDTLISVRAPVGAQNMASETCCIGRGVAAFRLSQNPMFIAYTFYKLRAMMTEFEQFNAEGTVFGSISKRDVSELPILLPPPDRIEKFHRHVGPVDAKVIANCKQIISLEKLRDTLLPKLMSGEVRVAS